MLDLGGLQVYASNSGGLVIGISKALSVTSPTQLGDGPRAANERGQAAELWAWLLVWPNGRVS